MLKSIRVTNFKVIEDSTLLTIQPLMVVIGRNGSGKSSLIEALDWLGRAVYAGAEVATEPYQRVRDIIHGWHMTTPSSAFTITVVLDPQDDSVGSELVYHVEVGADDAGLLPHIMAETLSANPRGEPELLIRTEPSTAARQYQVLGQGNQPLTWATSADPDRLALTVLADVGNRTAQIVRNFLTSAVFLRLNPRAIASFAPARLKPSPRLLDEEGVCLAALLSTFDQEMLAILVEKLSFILQRADHIDTHQPTGPADRRFFTLVERQGHAAEWDNQDENELETLGVNAPPAMLEIPAWTLSEGTRRITAILAVLLADNPPPLVCIEEVENGLDPWTIKYLLDELAGAVLRGTQVILTSHSPYLLNLLPLEAILFCHRQVHSVEFAAGDRLPDLEVLQQRMGPGDLYSNRYFHRSLEESPA